MKKIIVKLLILIFPIGLLFNGCASSKQEVKSHYRFEVIDSTLKNNDGNICFKLNRIDSYFIDKYNVLHCYYYIKENNKNVDTVLFFILSEKDSIIDFNLYDSLQSNKNYCLKLFTVDTIIKTGARFRGDAAFGYDDNDGCSILFWRFGKILTKVFFSKDLKDKYILKNKN